MPSRPAPAPGGSWLVRHGALVAVLVVLAFTSYIRLRLADVPLERDEGEYAYAGQLILNGVPPYALAYNMKFPGVYYAYSAMLALFGQTPWGIRVGLLLVNAATTLVLYRIAARVLGSNAAAATAASVFALLSLDLGVVGTFAHATHFVLLPALMGLLLLQRASTSTPARSFLVAGMLLGFAVLMKQHAAVFVPLALVLSRSIRRAVLVAAGSLLPLAVICGVFAIQGVLGKFWFWTFDYAKEYVSQVSLADGLSVLTMALGYVTRGTWAMWLLAVAGLAGLWIVRWPRSARMFLLGLSVATFLAVCPGFFFRPHYFVLMLPAVALLAGAAVASLSRLLGTAMPKPAAQWAAVALALAAAGQFVIGAQSWMFASNGTQISRAVYDLNPFPEAVEIGRYLAAHTAPSDRIAVLGSEPEIYFYARRVSGTGYIYTYPFSETQAYAARMRQEFIHEVEDARAPYVVLSSLPSSWMARPDADSTALLWARRYAETCYDVVGVADISSSQTTFVWDADAAHYQPRSQAVVVTLRRKHDGPCTASQ